LGSHHRAKIYVEAAYRFPLEKLLSVHGQLQINGVAHTRPERALPRHTHPHVAAAPAAGHVSATGARKPHMRDTSRSISSFKYTAHANTIPTTIPGHLLGSGRAKEKPDTGNGGLGPAWPDYRASKFCPGSAQVRCFLSGRWTFGPGLPKNSRK
jgi:hypothetical protein